MELPLTWGCFLEPASTTKTETKMLWEISFEKKKSFKKELGFPPVLEMIILWLLSEAIHSPVFRFVICGKVNIKH